MQTAFVLWGEYRVTRAKSLTDEGQWLVFDCLLIIHGKDLRSEFG